MRSALGQDIFKDELQHIYREQTERRDALKKDWKAMLNDIMEILLCIYLKSVKLYYWQFTIFKPNSAYFLGREIEASRKQGDVSL